MTSGRRYRCWENLPHEVRDQIRRAYFNSEPVIAIAARFDIGAETIHRQFSPQWAERRRETKARSREVWGRHGKRTVIHDRALELMLAVPADGRSLTGRLFGDPLPGRSALDMERAPRSFLGTAYAEVPFHD